MRQIHVEVPSRPADYPLVIGSGLFPRIAQDLSERPGTRYALITDSAVEGLWAEKLERALTEKGLAVERFVFPAGEAGKTRQVKEALEDQMLAKGFVRDSCVLALGGGVTGDLAGFTAATYMRGIPVVQIPTTTLSMADASIGGKTGVDTPFGKNLIGAFWHPQAVYMDMDVLSTLDERNFISGLAEVLKHGFIGDPSLLTFLEAHRDSLFSRDPRALEELFVSNCRVKVRVVSADARESGLRQILNYGHTLGHAVEMLAGFSLLHGECVSIGMAFAGYLSARMGLCSVSLAERQEQILSRYRLPVLIPRHLDADEMIRMMGRDKKVRGGKIRFVLPVEAGQVRYGVAAEEGLIREVIAERREE